MVLSKYKLISRAKNKGFTLMELIIVIVLLGIMAAGISGFMGLATQTYVNVTARDEIMSSARFAVERMNREIRNAVPNSVRINSNADSKCIEFLPIKASTVYIDIPTSPEAADRELVVIPFLGEDGQDYSCSLFCEDVVSIYSLIPDEIYKSTLQTQGKIFSLLRVQKTTTQEWSLILKKEVLFTEDSPTNRLYISKQPVMYCAYKGTLERYTNYDLSDNQYVLPSSYPVIMAENLDQATTSFNVTEATLQRNSLVQISLSFLKNNENIVFNHEIAMINTP